MGKSKPRNRTKNRDNPTARPVKPPSDPELATIREKKILPIFNDLKSAELKTRSAAALAITNIIDDAKCRKLLLREGIVRILMEQTLTDLNLDARTAGWGILRNLAMEEEADFCIYLYRQDILTAIVGVVTTIIQTIESQDVPLTKLPKAHQTLLWTLSGSVINLLSSLSEAQDEILEAITKLPIIVDFLFGILSLQIAPAEIHSETLSCLAALTEDNKPLAQQITDNGDRLKGLVQIRESGDFMGVTACGILHNIFTAMQWFDHNTPIEGASDASLIPTLVEYMEGAQVQMNGTNGHNSYSTPDQVLRLALDITASIATSLQEALEHGNKHEKEFEGFDDKDNLDDEMEHFDGDEEDDSNEMNEDELNADMELVTGDGLDVDGIADDAVTLDRLVRNVAPKLLVLAQSSQSSPENESIQRHALSALNNLAWTVSSIDFSMGHLDNLQKVWFSFTQQTWNEMITPVLASNTADVELASSITSLAWALSRSVQGKIQIHPEEQRKFMALYHASKGLNGSTSIQTDGTKKGSDSEQADSFQGLGVKCVGVLGQLALHPAPVGLNREIGVFLLNVLTALPETPAADAVEALNQIFDIYADKEFLYDEAVFWADGFYNHLQEILPKIKKMAKNIDKRKFMELRARADEANMNLGRFLRYKQKERLTKEEDE